MSLMDQYNRAAMKAAAADVAKEEDERIFRHMDWICDKIAEGVLFVSDEEEV